MTAEEFVALYRGYEVEVFDYALPVWDGSRGIVESVVAGSDEWLVVIRATIMCNGFDVGSPLYFLPNELKLYKPNNEPLPLPG